MSWQSDLHRYMELRDQLAQLESRESHECSCDSHNFHRCSLHDEIDEVSTESNRLKDIWSDLWACKLYRVCQGIDPATPVHFPVCEYRSPQLDGGTGQGLLIQCRNKAAMWTDRGLRCEDHRRD